MKFDPGTITVILACLIFYLRLLYTQRRKNQAAQTAGSRKSASGRVKGSRKHGAAEDNRPTFGSFSRNKRDWVVAAVGYLFIMIGVLLYTSVLKSEMWQPMWYLPTSIGIIAFSWLFN